MTGEEMERAIEFLLKSQADFEGRFEAEREQTNRQIRELAEGQQKTKEFLNQLSQIVAQNSQQISHLTDVLQTSSRCRTVTIKRLTLCSNSSAG